MRIAVIIKITSPDHPDTYRNVAREIFGKIVSSCPGHRFFFITDLPLKDDFITAPNAATIVRGPASPVPLLWRFWYAIRIPRLLRKLRADLLLCMDGICSPDTRVPQCLWLQDLGYLQEPALFSPAQRMFRKKYTPGSLKKAAIVITPTVFLKTGLEKQFGTDSRKMDVVPLAASEIFIPLQEEEKTAIKVRYTGGREYFIYSGPLHTEKKLVHLLKAFSGFKKRQQSSLKLVLLGNTMGKDKAFAESLAHYKYRDDVVMVTADEREKARLTGAAYAMICPSPKESFTVSVLEAMQCRVPVIVPANSAMEETAGGAALIAGTMQPEDLAEKMMRLYKDEKLRNELIEKGMEVCRQFNLQQTADLLWQSLQKALYPHQ